MAGSAGRIPTAFRWRPAPTSTTISSTAQHPAYPAYPASCAVQTVQTWRVCDSALLPNQLIMQRHWLPPPTLVT